MSTWLHRIKHCYEVSGPLLDKGYLSIGFSDFLSEPELFRKLSSPDVDPSDKYTIYDRHCKQCWGEFSTTVYGLDRFLNEFKPGDMVLVPNPGIFTLYKLVGQVRPITDLGPEFFKELRPLWGHSGVKIDDQYLVWENSGDRIDLGFIWPVTPGEPIKDQQNIPREYAEAALTSRLKIRRTNASLNGLEEDIHRAVDNYRNNRLPDLRSKTMEMLAGNLLEIIRSQLNPDKLEKLLKWYFYKIGANQVIIPAKNAAKKIEMADADIIATFENIKVQICVQAKYHEGETDAWAIDQILAFGQERRLNTEEVADYSELLWVVSTCDNYSQESISKAANASIRLIDGLGFAKMLLDAGLQDINKAFN